MRDIRRDLEERIALLKERVNAEKTALERQIHELTQAHEHKVRALTADLNAMSIVLRAEQRRFPISPPAAQREATPQKPEQPDQAQHRSLLLDLIRKLSSDGPACCEQLRQFAIQEGHIGDNDRARVALQEALTESAKRGIILQLPDGMFAASSITDLIRARREG
ncbi:MAG TPA: hypothetical protein VMW05_10190 [Methyloceanibacter sp.]|nr:hypothetical protein [Methyloceanibacter sp.]